MQSLVEYNFMQMINHSIVVFVIIDFPIIKLVFIASNYKLDIYSNYLSSIAKGNPYVESNFMQMINHSIVVFVIIDFPISDSPRAVVDVAAPVYLGSS